MRVPGRDGDILYPIVIPEGDGLTIPYCPSAATLESRRKSSYLLPDSGAIFWVE